MRSRATRRRVARKISTPTLHSKERDVTLSSVVEKGDRAGKLNEKKRTKRRRKAKNISRGRETEGEKERERDGEKCEKRALDERSTPAARVHARLYENRRGRRTCRRKGLRRMGNGLKGGDKSKGVRSA